jgi:hypothetical protein
MGNILIYVILYTSTYLDGDLRVKGKKRQESTQGVERSRSREGVCPPKKLGVSGERNSMNVGFLMK